MEIKEGYGTIEEKSEGIDKNNKKYWKFKIRCEDGKVNTFGLFEYDVGLAVSVGQQKYITWTEKEGQGQFGAIMYRNIKSIGDAAQYKKDPELAKKSDNQLATEAPPSSLKEAERPHTPSASVGGGSPQPYNQGARTGMIFNNAVALAIAEGKYTKENIESNFKYLKDLLDTLERGGQNL